MRKTGIIFIIAVLLRTSAYAADTECYVIPSGMSVGVKIYTDGLTVTGTQNITDIDGKTVNPAREYGIKKGDVIYSVNGLGLNTIEELAREVNANPDGVTLEIRRGCESLTINADPAETEDNTSKLGIWVRDSTAGIGTLTYYMPDNNSYAALGHGISDGDTGNILTVKSGNIQKCSELSVTKSTKGNPGELDAVFNGPEIGSLYVNSTSGIYGEMNAAIGGTPVKTAMRWELHEGEAYIMTDAAGNGVEYYSVDVQKIRPDSTDTKGIIFKVTDERLISTTGGIVRGMSGAPIIQDGKFAGAVTHVFVNDPSKGYGIIGENMISASVDYIG